MILFTKNLQKTYKNLCKYLQNTKKNLQKPTKKPTKNSKKNMQVSLQNLPIQPKSEQKKRNFENQLELRNIPNIHYSMPKYSQIGKKRQTNSK